MIGLQHLPAGMSPQSIPRAANTRRNDPYSHNVFSVASESSASSVAEIHPVARSETTSQYAYGAHRSQPASISSATQQASPSYQMIDDYDPELLHEPALGDICDLLNPPTSIIDDSDIPVPVGKPTLFLGHMRFETTAFEVAWLIMQTTGVRIIKAEPRPGGCFVIHLASHNDAMLVRTLHKRLLFDIGAVWYARTPEQVEAMTDYIRDTLLPKRQRREKIRVPHDALCVEDQKTPSAPRRNIAPAPQAGEVRYAQQQQHQQQQQQQQQQWYPQYQPQQQYVPAHYPPMQYQQQPQQQYQMQPQQPQYVQPVSYTTFAAQPQPTKAALAPLQLEPIAQQYPDLPSPNLVFHRRSEPQTPAPSYSRQRTSSSFEASSPTKTPTL